MIRGLQLTCLLAICSCAALAHAQGGVINIGVSSGKLVVSNGIADSAGFADQMFVETDSDGWATALNLSGFGPSYVWQIPGIRISDMAVNSGLYIEALARPVKDASPAQDRVLWYWSSITDTIQQVSAENNHFLIYKLIAGQGLVFDGSTSTTTYPFKIAAPQANDLNVDNYGGLVRFALHQGAPPPVGVYAFFARFKSDQYEPSEPFLLTFNHGHLAGSRMMTGALAINAAAVDLSLDGDFNLDGQVDAADYTVWRDNNYGPEQYDFWKNNFGASNGAGSATGGTSIPVPEPAAWTLAACGFAALVLRALPKSPSI